MTHCKLKSKTALKSQTLLKTITRYCIGLTLLTVSIVSLIVLLLTLQVKLLVINSDLLNTTRLCPGVIYHNMYFVVVNSFVSRV